MSNAAAGLQLSKKILIFLYVFCIFIFIFVSLFFLRLKSENYKNNLDAYLIRAFNSNKNYKVSYNDLQGDLLSEIEISGVNCRSSNIETSPAPFLFSANRVSFLMYPLSNITHYITRSKIPASINSYANRLAFGGITAEIGVISNKLAFSHNYALSSLEIFFDTILDFSSRYVKTSPENRISIKGKAGFKFGFNELSAVLSGNDLSVIISEISDGPALRYFPVSFLAEVLYNAVENKALVNCARISSGTCDFNIIKLSYLFSKGEISVELKICGLNTEDIFRAFPVSKFLVMSKNVEASLKYEGRIDDWRGGFLQSEIICTEARLLEYNTVENRLFTDAGAGDFVSSLGLTPDLFSRAGTISVALVMRNREIIIEKLDINASNYLFAASANAAADDSVKGGFTLSIPPEVLKNNTLKADFSSMKNGLKIYGHIIGDIYNPLIIYDMDTEAILKITRGVVFDKFKNFFSK